VNVKALKPINYGNAKTDADEAVGCAGAGN
jgi:hypothetical protein